MVGLGTLIEMRVIGVGRTGEEAGMPVSNIKSDDRGSLAQSAREGARQASEAGRKAVDEGVSTTREIASETAETVRSLADAGTSFAQSGAESVQRMVNSGMSMAARVAQRSADQFAWAWGFTGDDAREAAHESRRNMEAIAECGRVLAQRFQDVQQEWLGLARDRVEKNVDSFGAMLRCRTPQDLAAVQSGLVRDNLSFMLSSGRRMGEVSAEIANEAAQKIAEQADERRARAPRAA
jgi:hypothetical protein